MTDFLARLAAYGAAPHGAWRTADWELILFEDTAIVAGILLFPLFFFVAIFLVDRKRRPLFAQALTLLILALICLATGFPALN